MHQKKQWIALAISLALSQAAWARDGGAARFKLSGSGTLGVPHSSEDKPDVTPDFQTSGGVGASSATSAKLDSRLGVQFSAQFTDDFSGVVQAVSEYADTESYKPELTLAQKWDLTVNELTRNVHTHPTLSEALQEAFHGLAGHMINL